MTDVSFTSGDRPLSGHLAKPRASAAPRGRRPGLVLCTPFPTVSNGVLAVDETYPLLADRIAAMDGEWTVVSCTPPGARDDGANFSLANWIADVRGCVTYLLEEQGVDGVWLAGFSTGGSIAICAAAGDDRVRGVAALAAGADWGEWAADPRRFLAECRRVGAIRSESFPPDPDRWARDLRELRPLNLVAQIPPRPLLLVHGSQDELAPLADARVLADAAEGRAELRVITAGGHQLRHDPRAVAVLLGWLERQEV